MHGVCIKVFMTISGKDVLLLIKIKWIIVYFIYANSIIVLYIYIHMYAYICYYVATIEP